MFQLWLDCPVKGRDDDVGVTLSSPNAILSEVGLGPAQEFGEQHLAETFFKV